MNNEHIDNDDDLHQRAANYVIGTLDQADREAFEEELEYSKVARRAAVYWQERLAPLNHLSKPVKPSAFTLSRIKRSIDELSAMQTTSKHQKSNFWSGVGIWRFATAAMLVLCIGLAMQQKPTPTTLVVLTAPGQTQPGWMITSYDGEQLELKPLISTAVPANKTLQFWTKADGWDKPVSLGLVDPKSSLNTQLDSLPDITPNQLFELTIEQAGGSPTGLPTGPIQYIGRAVIDF